MSLIFLVREACKAGNRMRFSTEDVQRLVVAPKTYNRRSGNDLKFHQVLHNVAGAALFMGYYMVSESDNLSKPFQKPYTEILKIILERSTSDWEAYKDEKVSRLLPQDDGKDLAYALQGCDCPWCGRLDEAAQYKGAQSFLYHARDEPGKFVQLWIYSSQCDSS